jgi:DNA polymerase-1
MPQNNVHNESLILLDARGLVTRRYSVASTTDGIRGTDGKVYAQWYRGVLDFLTKDLQPLLDMVPPRRIICCWDGGNNYRSSLYPGYKKTRKERDSKVDPILKEQHKELYDYVKNLTAYLGIKHVHVPGQEADDLIALFCKQMPERRLLVKTVDADLLQLAGDYSHVTVELCNKSGEYGAYSLDEDGSGMDKTSYKDCPLGMIRLQKSILGDTSDSYNGVQGMGPAAWAKLVDSYGWDGMAQLDEAVRTKDFAPIDAALTATNDTLLGKLLSHKQDWIRAYILASLNPDVCYQVWGKKIVLPKWYVRLPIKDEFASRLKAIGAEDLLPHFEKWLVKERLLDANHHDILRELQSEILKSPVAAYDFESEDTLQHEPFQEAYNGKGSFVDVLSQKVTGVSFCIGENLNQGFYVPTWHKDTFNLSREWIKYVIETCSVNKAPVAHNASFELTVARADMGLESPAPFDTTITASYVDENESAGLKGLALSTFNYHQTSYAEVTQGRGMSELTGEEVLSYGCDDSIVSAHLFDLHRLIMQLEGSWSFYLEQEVLPAADDADTFIAGTRIDFPYLEQLQREDAAAKADAEKTVRSHLEQHCMNKDVAAQTAHATTLYNEGWEVMKLKAANRKHPPTAEELEEKRKEFWAKCWYDATYRPYIEETQPIEFSPTPKQLTAVVKLLGAEAPIEKNNATYISDWLYQNEESLQESDLSAEFLKTLGPASTRLSVTKKRTGEDYQKFYDVCIRILTELGEHRQKVTTSGDELNFDSPVQMTSLLYGKLGLPVRRRSKITKGSFRDIHGLSGSPATGNKAIASALVFDEAETPDSWRSDVLNSYKTITSCLQNNKLYYTPYPLWQHPRDGLIHPQIKNCGTVTRRPSGTSPNKLQVSKKNDAKIRKAFPPYNDEHCYVCHDFNGQELRLTASESKDPVMIDAYIGEKRKDLHSLTSASIAQYILPRRGLPEYAGKVLPYEEFIAGRKDPKLSDHFNHVRDIYAKPTNFLIIFLGKPRTLAENLLIPLDLSENVINGTYGLYARLSPWQQEVIEFGRTHGYVQTAYGIRRHLSADITSEDGWLRSRMERQAVNYIIQGCAAGILKIVKTEMAKRKMAQRYHLKSQTPIYDEMAVSCPIAAAPEYSEEMAEIMAITPPGHQVPMEAEVAIGLKSWGHKEELDSTSAEAVSEFLRKAKDSEA